MELVYRSISAVQSAVHPSSPTPLSNRSPALPPCRAPRASPHHRQGDDLGNAGVEDARARGQVSNGQNMRQGRFHPHRRIPRRIGCCGHRWASACIVFTSWLNCDRSLAHFDVLPPGHTMAQFADPVDWMSGRDPGNCRLQTLAGNSRRGGGSWCIRLD